jgi:hypothetical protein
MSLARPVFFLDTIDGGVLLISALFVAPGDAEPPPTDHSGGTVRARRLARYGSALVWRALFALPQTRARRRSPTCATTCGSAFLNVLGRSKPRRRSQGRLRG